MLETRVVRDFAQVLNPTVIAGDAMQWIAWAVYYRFKQIASMHLVCPSSIPWKKGVAIP